MRNVAFAICLALVAGCTEKGKDRGVDDMATDAGADDADALRPPCEDAGYRCPELCSEGLVLVGGGRRAEECSGDCAFELRFATSPILDGTGCDVSGTLHVESSDGSERFVNFALGPDAQRELLRISHALRGSSVDELGDCADCSDEGAVWITHAAHGLDGSEHKLHYEPGSAPGALRQADGFVQRLIDSALVCSATDSDLWACTISDAPAVLKCDAFLSDVSCGTLPSGGQISTVEGLPCGRCGVYQISGDSRCTLRCKTFCNSHTALWVRSCSE